MFHELTFVIWRGSVINAGRAERKQHASKQKQLILSSHIHMGLCEGIALVICKSNDV